VSPKADSSISYVDLVHPLYLDVPMLVSFLATLEGGVTYSSEIAQVAQNARKSGAEMATAAKLPDLASLLGLNLSMSGKLQRNTEESQSVETRIVRQHTAASLFNTLRNRLFTDSTVRKIRTVQDLPKVVGGSIVELSGEVTEGPLQRLVDFVNNIFPFAQESIRRELAKLPDVRRGKRSQLSPEQLAELEHVEAAAAAFKLGLENIDETMRFIALIEQDLKNSPVVDFVVQGDGIAGFLAMHREFLTDDLVAGVLGGAFKVLGKVTAVNPSADARVAVVRRGAMGSLSEDTITEVLSNIQRTVVAAGLRLELPEGHLHGPHVQILPLAVFV
jgi:hypothetical protein